MKALVAVVAAAALVLTGCADQKVTGTGVAAGGSGFVAASSASSGSASSGSTSSASRSASAPASGGARSSAELQAVLLRAEDLGEAGWTLNPSDSSSDDSGDDDSCGSGDLTDPTTDAEADFSKSELGPFLFEELGSTPSEAIAKDTFTKGVAEFKSCSGQTQSDGSSYTVTDVSFPKLGDQSHAFQLSEAPSATQSGSLDVPVTITLVLVQDGRLLEIYGYFALSGGTSATLQTAAKNGAARAHLLR